MQKIYLLWRVPDKQLLGVHSSREDANEVVRLELDRNLQYAIQEIELDDYDEYGLFKSDELEYVD